MQSNLFESSEINQEAVTTPNENDDRLIIKIDGKDHLVDSIVQFKKTTTGIS